MVDYRSYLLNSVLQKCFTTPRGCKDCIFPFEILSDALPNSVKNTAFNSKGINEESCLNTKS